ncbi:hypothetical protein TTHERM_00760450 (macronuclear) [Tetrahymena thermophila SB210]|uniref:Uncharacterized protein n=1 Tax=Tetrahymena thermophila (strain SB210) TaxID=312017 RepID=I7LZI5_TETTS|nr:hypothetical protein TTHERM_00760450 [Tetrahymena thermophila SB210]EAR83998.2 hypothetical protein TTHERM_00760450 [Tetrahymena thermophila SB210]|eukprot:XP_001031661.2 hypothetical protein TTHERM_00760450 [Tetrahymena thermophila SB210]
MQKGNYQQRRLENQRPTFEENDDLFSNMSKLHNKIHQNNYHQEFQQKFQNESSSSYPQSINNFDKIVKQNDTINQNKQKSEEADIIQQSQVFGPCQRFFDQSCSSRSINLQNTIDVSQTTRPFVQYYQNHQQFLNNTQVDKLERKQLQENNLSQQNSLKFGNQVELSCRANKTQFFQANQFDKYSIKELNQQKESITNNVQSITSIKYNQPQQRKNTFYQILTSKMNKQEQVDSARLEKGIFLIKNLLPNLGQKGLRIQQRVKQFVEQLQLSQPNRNNHNLNEQIYKIIDDKNIQALIVKIYFQNQFTSNYAN